MPPRQSPGKSVLAPDNAEFHLRFFHATAANSSREPRPAQGATEPRQISEVCARPSQTLRISADCRRPVADDNFCQTDGLFSRIIRNDSGRPADNQICVRKSRVRINPPAIPSEVPKHIVEGQGPQNGPCAHGQVHASLEANSTVAIRHLFDPATAAVPPEEHAAVDFLQMTAICRTAVIDRHPTSDCHWAILP